MVNKLDPSDGTGHGSSFLLKLYTVKGRKFLEYLSKYQSSRTLFHRTVTSYDNWITVWGVSLSPYTKAKSAAYQTVN
jgi:hypothetical protein